MSSVVPFEILYALELAQMILSIGVFISALFTGGTIVLGVACLFLLSSDTPGFSKRYFLLRAYVVLLLLAVIGLEVACFLATHSFSAFHAHSIGQLLTDRWGAMLGILVGLPPAIVTGLTDGLLVWRCYMVHQTFEQTPSPVWKNIFWIFPALLWILNVVSGVIVAPVTRHLWCNTVAFICNAVLNLYATGFIALRLLQHRRMLIAVLGTKVQTKRDVYIMGLLVESAVINVPVALAAAIGLRIPGALFSPVISPIVGSGQAFGSVLIIHQIAIGRAFDRQRERDTISRLTTEGGVLSVSEEETRPEEVA